jgi:tetratricopeptide (TPR) repeat protein
MQTTRFATLVLLSAVCAGTPFARGDERLLVIPVKPQCCRPCATDAAAVLADPKFTAWVERHGRLVEYDPERTPELVPAMRHLGFPCVWLLNPDGSKLGTTTWDADAAAMAMSLDELRAPNEEAAVRRREAIANGTDPMSVADRADSLVQAGEHAEALSLYLWCFDHGLEVDTAYRGVRLSFLLSDLADLGRLHPPARRALEERVDLARKTVASDPSNFEAWREFTALANHLDDQELVLSTIAGLDRSTRLGRRVRLHLLEYVLGPLVRLRRYEDVLRLCEDSTPELVAHWLAEFEALERAEEQRDRAVHEIERGEGSVEAIRAQHRSRLEVRSERACWRVFAVYEAELAAGVGATAEALAKRATEFAPVAATYDALANAALRAGRSKLAVRWLRSGIEDLPSDETRPLTVRLQALYPDRR